MREHNGLEMCRSLEKCSKRRLDVEYASWVVHAGGVAGTVRCSSVFWGSDGGVGDVGVG